MHEFIALLKAAELKSIVDISSKSCKTTQSLKDPREKFKSRASSAI